MLSEVFAMAERGILPPADGTIRTVPQPSPAQAAVVAFSAHDDRSHPRARRAHRYRSDVRVYAADGGIVLLGRGLAGRWETAFEVDPGHRGNELGRRLATAARHLVPGPAVWAQVSPGNATSVRALIAAGYRPVGAEALLVSPPTGDPGPSA